jgi:hypothetical protein
MSALTKHRQISDQRKKQVAKRQMGGFTERWMANHIELGTKIERWLTEC